ncbi:hypothetical protein EDD11_003747 [Mortierella claussenii]|nr:hypothetical protein EDD11_003747 [Mortierella claussenii]
METEHHQTQSTTLPHGYSAILLLLKSIQSYEFKSKCTRRIREEGRELQAVVKCVNCMDAVSFLIRISEAVSTIRKEVNRRTRRRQASSQRINCPDVATKDKAESSKKKIRDSSNESDHGKGNNPFDVPQGQHPQLTMYKQRNPCCNCCNCCIRQEEERAVLNELGVSPEWYAEWEEIRRIRNLWAHPLTGPDEVLETGRLYARVKMLAGQ